MQYMSAANGGLVVDFTPIRDYGGVATGEMRGVRARTVLDWMAFATELGVLDRARLHRLFARPADFLRFARDLRDYDLPAEARHRLALEALGLVRHGDDSPYAAAAAAISAQFTRVRAA
jgi:hypothetical protein